MPSDSALRSGADGIIATGQGEDRRAGARHLGVPEIRPGTVAGGVLFDFVTIDWLIVRRDRTYLREGSGEAHGSTALARHEGNVPSTSGIFPIVQNYKAQFLKVWGKSK